MELLKVLKIKTLDSYPSGSSLDFYDGRIYLIGDDAKHIAVLDTDFNQVDDIPLFLHEEVRVPKREKRDIETSTIMRIKGKDSLVLIGSGSKRRRKRLFIVPLNQMPGLPKKVLEQDYNGIKYARFIHKLEKRGLEVNIEGCAVIGDHVVLSNRGHKLNPGNHLIVTEKEFWSKQKKSEVSINKINLPEGAGISELTYDIDSDVLFFTATTEETGSTYEDGKIGDSFIGYISEISEKINGDDLEMIPDQVINLSKEKKFTGHKIEGICIEKKVDNKYTINLVSDNDDGKSTMFKIEVKTNNTASRGKKIQEFGEILKIKDIENIKSGDVLGFVYKEEGKTTYRDFGAVDFFDENDKWRGFDIDGWPFEFDRKLSDEEKNNPEFELKDIENSGTYWSLYFPKAADGKKIKTWYHGTDSKFGKFDASKIKGGPSVFGIWFTDGEELAKMFGENIYEAKLNYKNPKVISFDEYDEMRDEHAKDTEYLKDFKNKLISEGYDALFVTERESTFAGQKVRDPNMVAVFNEAAIEIINPEEEFEFYRRANKTEAKIITENFGKEWLPIIEKFLGDIIDLYPYEQWNRDGNFFKYKTIGASKRQDGMFYAIGEDGSVYLNHAFSVFPTEPPVKAADGQEIVNHPGMTITFKNKEDAKAAKKKLNDFDNSLVWEYGDAELGAKKNMLLDNKLMFDDEIDFKIALNLLNLEYKDLSEFKWFLDVVWDSTPNGVPFTEDTHGPHGAAFVVYPLPYHTEEDIKKAKQWLRNQKDVVSLKIASDYEWDDIYKSAYFRDPRVRPLKWYQIEQDEKLIRKERKKGTTPKEFVDKFVLPHIGRTEDRMRGEHGEKIYQMADGGLIAPNGKKSNLTPEQYRLVRTPEFKAWFGNWENDPENSSKVVDENGEPLVVYHGTYKEFYVFGEGQRFSDIEHIKNTNYFHKSKKYVEKFGFEKPYFLNIRNIALITQPIMEKIGYTKDVYDEYVLKGFNGVYSEEGEYATLNNANQIKLADGSNTTFDGNNPDIRYAGGGGIPERYKNMGFTKVGQKKKSTRPDKKWMVLARKGDKYKVVHGGYKGMEDYSQHHDDVRRKRFWNRMGGFDSPKANDPFSPLYWHKKFGTWEDGGIMTEEYAGGGRIVYRNENFDKGGPVPDLHSVIHTPEFISWFGDWQNDPKNASKAVKHTGEPAIFYHGSSDKNITVFSRFKSKSNENTIGQFIYFSKEKEYSSQERFVGKDGALYQVYLNIRKPLNLFDEVGATDISRFFRFTGAPNRPDSFDKYWRGDWSSAFEEILSQNENPDLATAVTKFGYDAVYYHNSAGDEMYAVINSNQIKSAVGNTTFDPKNDNIYAKDGRKIDTQKTAYNWWRHTLSINEQNAYAKKHLLSFEIDALIGSTSQYASAKYQNELIERIWEKEGSPEWSDWLHEKYGVGDLTDKDYTYSRSGGVGNRIWSKVKDQAEDGTEIPVIEEEEYLAIHGASRQGFGDSALHKNRGGASDKTWTKIIDAQAKKDRELMDLREKLRAEYAEKVAKGEIRPPSRYEKLISTAQGNPDREDVQAARRILEKKGISWS